jgi:accessory colonization factor AcfC
MDQRELDDSSQPSGGPSKAEIDKVASYVRSRLTREINYWDACAARLREEERAGKEQRINANNVDPRPDPAEPDAYDAWLIWNIWQVANRGDADLVDIEEPFRIWRSTGTVLTRRGAGREEARHFASFVAGAEGAAIFRQFGLSG